MAREENGCESTHRAAWSHMWQMVPDDISPSDRQSRASDQVSLPDALHFPPRLWDISRAATCCIRCLPGIGEVSPGRGNAAGGVDPQIASYKTSVRSLPELCS
jgi:hypothetical protein